MYKSYEFLMPPLRSDIKTLNQIDDLFFSLKTCSVSDLHRCHMYLKLIMKILCSTGTFHQKHVSYICWQNYFLSWGSHETGEEKLAARILSSFSYFSTIPYIFQ